MLETHKGDKKFKRFFRFAIPVLILEVLAAVGLIVFLAIIPRNSYVINTNYNNAIFYINDEKSNKIKLNTPKEYTTFNNYEFDVYLEIPEDGEFEVIYTIKCDKYVANAKTHLSSINGEYIFTVYGKTRTKIMSGVVIKSEERIKNFEVVVDVDIKKISG